MPCLTAPACPDNPPPFTVAVVMLEEGVKMLTNLVDCPPDPGALELDMPLELTFEQRGDIAVPQFRPASAKGAAGATGAKGAATDKATDQTAGGDA